MLPRPMRGARSLTSRRSPPTSTPVWRERGMFWKRGMVKGAPGKGWTFTFWISSHSSMS